MTALRAALPRRAGEIDGFPPIASYGFIGDCRTGALIGADGAVDWLCLPNFDSFPVFARLLDRRRGGHMTLRPIGDMDVSRRYIEGTNVLETTYRHPGGSLRVTDCLAVFERGDEGLAPERELVRLVESLDGSTQLELVYAPRPDFGRRPPRLAWRYGTWTAGPGAPLYLLHTDIPLEPDADGSVLRGQIRLTAGERRSVSLSVTTRDPAVLPGPTEAAARKCEGTVRWWRDWSARCTYEGPYREDVLRSVLVLKLLQFSLSGAVIAAPTTSLPEAIGAGRNWDYRFCWLRDAAFTLRAFSDLGFNEEGVDFFGWLTHATRMTQPRLQVLYDVFGRTHSPEREVPDLSGYRDSHPVRTGNRALHQLQIDVYGYVVAAARAHVVAGNELDPWEARLLGRLGEAVCDVWREPDNGIWEFRNGRRHNTWSKVACWSALNDILALQSQGLVKADRARLEAERDAIGRAVMEHGFHTALGSFVGAFGSSHVDSALLLMPRYHFIDADDPKMTGTYERIVDRLGDGPLIRRYEAGVDGMEGSEGSFVICSLWAVDYLARAGRIAEARDRMERILALQSELGLFSEEIDLSDGSFLGNFPQAFSHSGLINAAVAIRQAEARHR
jgi:GH15 family glucan-1,4-alpha-glucosidase